MNNVTDVTRFLDNGIFPIIASAPSETLNVCNNNETFKVQSIRMIQSTIASLGIVTNLTVIVVFLNHKKLRRKIPNIFIINQVRKYK